MVFPIGKMAKSPSEPIAIRSAAELGAIVRQARHEGAADQASTAALAGVGVRFLGDVERGKPSVRLGLVLQVLQRLGLEVWIAPRGWRPRDR